MIDSTQRQVSKESIQNFTLTCISYSNNNKVKVTNLSTENDEGWLNLVELSFFRDRTVENLWIFPFIPPAPA